MQTLAVLIKRNIKLFLKDKALFFVAMISPMVLLILFLTFLGDIYKDNLLGIFEMFGMSIGEDLLDGTVIVYLFSSLLSVSCVTVAFCCNVISIQDKMNGVVKDFMVTPTRKIVVTLSYLIATFLVSLLIDIIMFGALMIILGVKGQFYFGVGDILKSLGDIVLLSGFGAVLSSIVCYFCSTQPQLGAITGIVSSCYGFLCGAYMPISEFAEGIRNIISVLPGTYGTTLLKSHLTTGYLDKIGESGVSGEAIEAIKKGFDLRLSVFGNEMGEEMLYAVMAAAIIALFLMFALVVFMDRKRGLERGR